MSSDSRTRLRAASAALIIGFAIITATGPKVAAQTGQPDWKALEAETLQHFQAMLRLDTSNPPGTEHLVTDYVRGVLEKEGIPVQIVASNPDRPNLIAERVLESEIHRFVRFSYEVVEELARKN